jgi:hypothetical protein
LEQLISGAGGGGGGGGEPLLRLPSDVMRAVLDRLLPADRAALRSSSRAGRAAANARVARMVLYESDLEAAGQLQLSEVFPDLKEVRITLDGSSRAGADDDSDEDGSGAAAGTWRPQPSVQLPGRFAGSCTLSAGAGAGGGAGRVTRGRRRGVVEARAAAVLARCAPEVCGFSHAGDRTFGCCM